MKLDEKTEKYLSEQINDVLFLISNQSELTLKTLTIPELQKAVKSIIHTLYLHGKADGVGHALKIVKGKK